MMDSFKRAFTFDDYKSGKVIIAGDLVDIKSQDILNYNTGERLPLLPRPFKKEKYIYSLLSDDRMRTDVGQGSCIL